MKTENENANQTHPKIYVSSSSTGIQNRGNRCI